MAGEKVLEGLSAICVACIKENVKLSGGRKPGKMRRVECSVDEHDLRRMRIYRVRKDGSSMVTLMEGDYSFPLKVSEDCLEPAKPLITPSQRGNWLPSPFLVLSHSCSNTAFDMDWSWLLGTLVLKPPLGRFFCPYPSSLKLLMFKMWLGTRYYTIPGQVPHGTWKLV